MSKQKDIIIGINALIDAIKFSDIVSAIYIQNGLDFNRNKGISKIAAMARQNNIKMRFVDKHQLDVIAGKHSHQGVIAKAKTFKYSKLRDVLSMCDNKESSLILVLDHIKDAGNLGAIIRSAEASGASAIIIPNKRCAEVSASTYKTSAGSVINIPIVQVSNISAALDNLKQHEFWVCAASEHAKDELWDCNLEGKLALVMGGEHEGIAPLVLKNSDFTAKLPIVGRVESLNVAQACAIFCYEWVRQNR